MQDSSSEGDRLSTGVSANEIRKADVGLGGLSEDRYNPLDLNFSPLNQLSAKLGDPKQAHRVLSVALADRDKTERLNNRVAERLPTVRSSLTDPHPQSAMMSSDEAVSHSSLSGEIGLSSQSGGSRKSSSTDASSTIPSKEDWPLSHNGLSSLTLSAISANLTGDSSGLARQEVPRPPSVFTLGTDESRPLSVYEGDGKPWIDPAVAAIQSDEDWPLPRNGLSGLPLSTISADLPGDSSSPLRQDAARPLSVSTVGTDVNRLSWIHKSDGKPWENPTAEARNSDLLKKLSPGKSTMWRRCKELGSRFAISLRNRNFFQKSMPSYPEGGSVSPSWMSISEKHGSSRDDASGSARSPISSASKLNLNKPLPPQPTPDQILKEEMDMNIEIGKRQLEEMELRLTQIKRLRSHYSNALDNLRGNNPRSFDDDTRSREGPQGDYSR